MISAKMLDLAQKCKWFVKTVFCWNKYVDIPNLFWNILRDLLATEIIRSDEIQMLKILEVIMGSGRVSHLLDLESFPQKSQMFQFFSPRVKKISLGEVKKYMGQWRAGLLFSVGQKYAWIGSGPILALKLTIRPWPKLWPQHWP